jgi:hypothetical protein
MAELNERVAALEAHRQGDLAMLQSAISAINELVKSVAAQSQATASLAVEVRHLSETNSELASKVHQMQQGGFALGRKEVAGIAGGGGALGVIVTKLAAYFGLS